MKGNPGVPGGPLTSKPAWPNTSGCSATPVFFAIRTRDMAVQAFLAARGVSADGWSGNG